MNAKYIRKDTYKEVYASSLKKILKSVFHRENHLQNQKLTYQNWTSINFFAVNDCLHKKRHLKGNFYMVFEGNRSSYFSETWTSINFSALNN